MTFSSIDFLIFLPAVFLLYWMVCSRSKNAQNMLIAISSAVFYGWWDWKFLGLVFVTAFSTFYAGKFIQYSETKIKKKVILFSAVSINVGILFYLKYFDFFVNSFIDLMNAFGVNASEMTLNIILPVGISFYTFSALSYVIDVYQDRCKATNDAIAYLAYVLFFPSILSGPISRAQKQLPQYLIKREFSYENAVTACKSMILGGVIKYCLADRLGMYVDAVYAHVPQHSGITLFVASICYTIQIYADFAGYSLMAIGSGLLFGIKLQTNFLRPYLATTITDFWRRWHISLTTWFRDYIYFPLGGNRVSKMRWMLNTMIVFTVSGLWHGAAYTFLIWGVLHGFCMIMERLLYGEKIKQVDNKICISNVIRMCITFTIVSFAWIFFRAESLYNAVEIISGIFTHEGSLFTSFDSLLLALPTFLILLIYDVIIEYKINFNMLSSKYKVVRYVTLILLICYILAFGVLNDNSFIYFQF